MKRNIILQCCLIIVSVILISGCATALIESMHGGKPLKYTKTENRMVFSDAIISYGIPAAPIKNYEYAIAIAGQKHSYLIQPSESIQKPCFVIF